MKIEELEKLIKDATPGLWVENDFNISHYDSGWMAEFGGKEDLLLVLFLRNNAEKFLELWKGIKTVLKEAKESGGYDVDWIDLNSLLEDLEDKQNEN